MKSRTRIWTTVVYLFAALAIPVGVAAQDNPSQKPKPKHHQYKLIDLGTFGGPNSLVPAFSNVGINSQGTVMVQGDTTIPDPYAPNCFWDCLVNHPGVWQDGILTDLGVLQNPDNSCQPTWINDGDVVVGACENGLIDPLANYPEIHGVVWKNGQIIDIGTLGGNTSSAGPVNNRGQVTGLASNTIPDPFNQSLGPPSSFWNFGVTQIHAFLWQHGPMQDLGTLGGPDSAGMYVNEHGQVAGVSYTSFTPNPGTGIPTQDPFLWDKGTMKDLGTLGGTAGWPWALNQRGQVVGQSNLAGDTANHPFLWDKKNGMIDLGTLGGSNGHATWINDAGEVVGVANLPGDTGHDAFLWKNGVMTDLGNLGVTSFAWGINSSGQVVGNSRVNSTTVSPFLWEDGGPMVDLNSLVIPGSGLRALNAQFINDRGEIAGTGQLANGDVHATLLIPCDEKHPGECQDYSMIEASTTQTSAPTTMKQGSESPADTVNSLRNRFGRGFYLSGQPAAPRD